MRRRLCCDKIAVKKGPWTGDEDKKLRDFIHTNGTKYSWRAVPKRAGLLRCGKSCRLRWVNYLKPDVKTTEPLSKKEEKLVVDLHSEFGNKWSKIASYLPGRTDNYIKNYWRNHIKKRLGRMGIDSITHKPHCPDPPTFDQHNKSQTRGEMHGQEIDETSLLEYPIISNDNNYYIAKENLTIDTGFSIDEISLIEGHEILIPCSDHLPVNYCSSASCPAPRAPTSLSLSNINSTVKKLKPSPYWHNNDLCKNYDRNMSYSYKEEYFKDWDWLINDFDIDKIDHDMIVLPPHDASLQYPRNDGSLG